MNVAELIRLLKELPQEAEVWHSSPGGTEDTVDIIKKGFLPIGGTRDGSAEAVILL